MKTVTMTATVTRNIMTGMRYEGEEFLLLPVLKGELFAFGVSGSKLFMNFELELLEFI
jgi:hypothetical protein